LLEKLANPSKGNRQNMQRPLLAWEQLNRRSHRAMAIDCNQCLAATFVVAVFGKMDGHDGGSLHLHQEGVVLPLFGDCSAALMNVMR
jgi:hypothetical protein